MSIQATEDMAFHLPPPGSEVLQIREHGWCTMRKVHAKAGAFRTRFSRYTIVVGDDPSCGPLQFNGTPVMSPCEQKGAYSVYRPNDEASGSLTYDTVYSFLHLDNGFVSQVLQHETSNEAVRLPPTLRSVPRPLFETLWTRIWSSLHSTCETSNEISRTCAQVLLVSLVEPQLRNAAHANRDRRSEAVSRVTAHIGANLRARLSLEHLSRLAGISTFHFARVFKARTGLSVHQYVMECRLESARALLTGSDNSISRIALETGFSSQSHLTTAFKKRFGMTPKAYREAAGTTTCALEHN
jgi:AraC-like DNA-binding protein